MSDQRRITLGELPEPFKVVSRKREGIENYDIDNAYPSRMERLINGSVTAKSSASMLSRFLIGKGFEDSNLNKIIIGHDNYKRPITAFKLLRQIAVSTAYYAGYYVHAQFDANLNVTGLAYEDFKNCRFGLKNHKDYSGHIVVYNNWDYSKSQKIKKEDYICVPVWNMNEAVIKSQIEKAKGIKTYKGQIFFNFLDEYYIYPLSPIDPVFYDADTEHEISMFKNGELRRGFFMKKIIHHTQFNSQSEADDFKNEIVKFQGGGHKYSFMVLEAQFDPDTGALQKENNIAIENIEQNIDDKIFESYEKSCINNIRKAYNAIPQILIDYEDSKLGTTSGEALYQASQFYNQMTEELRMAISESFKEMFFKWKDKDLREKNWNILPTILGEKSEPQQARFEIKQTR